MVWFKRKDKKITETDKKRYSGRVVDKMSILLRNSLSTGNRKTKFSLPSLQPPLSGKPSVLFRSFVG